MRQPLLAACCCVSLMAGCADQMDQVPEPRKTPTEIETNESARSGSVGHGIMATFYDRDGDRHYEEARRSTTVYYDRNGDGITDLQVNGDAGGGEGIEIVLWDDDFDGILDQAVDAEIGYVFRLVNQRPIHTAGPRIFLHTGINRHSRIACEDPKFRFWESVAKIPPWKPKAP